MASAPPGQGGLKMFDINEIIKRTQQAKEQALDAVKETMEKNEERINETLKKAHLYLPLKLKNRFPLILNIR